MCNLKNIVISENEDASIKQALNSLLNNAIPFPGCCLPLPDKERRNTPRPALSDIDRIYYAIIASKKLRLEKITLQGSIRLKEIIKESIDCSEPIPFLVPWGSKKHNNKGIDSNELFALLSIRAMAERVKAIYPKGVVIHLRIDDISGYHLYFHDGDIRRASQQYVFELKTLIAALDMPYLKPVPESSLVKEDVFMEMADRFTPIFVQYLASTKNTVEGYEENPAWQELNRAGWSGAIPLKQRAYLLQLYKNIYRQFGEEIHLDILARNYADTMTRNYLGAQGKDPDWGKHFIQINFNQLFPGSLPEFSLNRISYRTIPSTYTHSCRAAWRETGHFVLRGNKLVPKSSLEGTLARGYTYQRDIVVWVHALDISINIHIPLYA